MASKVSSNRNERKPNPTGSNTNNSNTHSKPPLGALLRHLPTPELVELEIAIRSILYVLSDNLCPLVKAHNDRRRVAVNDVLDMFKANGAVAELYGSGRTGLATTTSSDLDFVVVFDGAQSLSNKSNDHSEGMSVFYRPQVSTKNRSAPNAKRSRDGDESFFFEENYDSEEDDDGSLRSPTSATSFGGVGSTRSQRGKQMAPIIRGIINSAMNYRRTSSPALGPRTPSANNGVLGGNNFYPKRGQQIFTGFKPIIHAKVPLVKCFHRTAHLSLDFSFALDGAKSSDYLITKLSPVQQHQCLAAARGLVVLLKHLLHEGNLNDPSVGGLGSFPLSLMVIWFLETEVHRNFPLELQGSYAVLLTRFLAYYGETFDGKYYGIDCAGKEMFEKAGSTVLMIKNPLDRSLNAASACTRYFAEVQPLFLRLNKTLMGAMAPADGKKGRETPSQIAERMFLQAVKQPQSRNSYEAFASTLRALAADADASRSPKITPVFLRSVLAPVSTRWGAELVCETEGIGLGTQWV